MKTNSEDRMQLELNNIKNYIFKNSNKKNGNLPMTPKIKK